MLEIVVFNIGAGQSIFFYPNGQKEYAMLIDCHESEDFSPIDFLLEKGLLHHDGNRHVLGNLTITNYDHDHFSGLPKIMGKVHIDTVRLPKNISSQELKDCKEESTDALEKICHLKDTYTGNAENHTPPYRKLSYYLDQNELDNNDINTNHLSQIVFIEYGDSHICVAGDLEATAWEKILQKQGVIENLQKTNVLIAPHHGRENGYHADIFKHCTPECIVISDKALMYGTQDAMAQTYSNHVVGNGVSFGNELRKVLTTRKDGHILISFDRNGKRSYQSLSI